MTDVLEHLYKTRGLYTEEQKDFFLKPDFTRDSHDPYLLSDMDVVISRIQKAKEHNETVGIYADYDCDGVPGAVILSDFLEKVGIQKIPIYIPDRHLDGYGLSNKGIDELISNGATLIITIDLGITGFDGALYCKEKNVDLIITDHHLPHEKLPEAFVVINPKKDGDAYPFKELCGTGVVFKVIQAYIQKNKHQENFKDGFEKWLLDLVGLATLSDMVPLVGENRVFAYYGLIVMKKTKRPGLLALYKNAGIKKETLAEDDITHTVTPRLNAASRMGDVLLAYKILKTNSKQEAEELVKKLSSLNNSRKAHVAHIIKEIYSFPEQVFKDSVVVVGSPKWRPGVLGLVAAKLVDQYKKPVFVWGGEDDDILKGSCRSIDGVSVVEIMHKTKDFFEHYGGHTGAGGFSISKRNVHDASEVLSRAYDELGKGNFSQTQENKETVSSLPLSTISDTLFNHISTFAPFGLGNEKPVFRFEQAILESFKMFGKTGEHLECIFSISGKNIKAIAFFKKEDSYGRALSIGDVYTVLAHVEKSYFFKVELRLRLIDIY